MSQVEARAEAIRRAREALAAMLAAGRESLESRCSRLGLPRPGEAEVAAGEVDFPLFGSPARLDLSSLRLTDAAGAERSQTDQILFYHYFRYEGAVPGRPAAADPASAGPAGAASELISFRDLKGGAFYWEPFRSRTCLPLARRYGADVAGLRAALDRFEWEEVALGDFGARVHAMGNLHLSLAWHAAEEGIEAGILVLFDPAIRPIFQAEDAAAMASRICLGLL